MPTNPSNASKPVSAGYKKVGADGGDGVRYKKNVKRLFVVHPSVWFKFIIWIMSNILR